MFNNCMLEIKEKGYTQLKSLISQEDINRIKCSVISLSDNNGNIGSDDGTPYLNQGHKIVYNVQNKDISLYTLFTRNQVIREILIQCLNDQWYKQIPKDKSNYILRSLIARTSGPHQMPLHIDSFIPNNGDYIWMMQVSIILEPQNQINGCTVVIPGSHKFGEYAPQDWFKYASPVISEPGDVVIWDSRLWHGAYENQTENTRWALIGTFGRWWIKQNFQITNALPKEFISELTDEELSILGYCSLPAYDEHDRLDIKAGYDILKKIKS